MDSTPSAKVLARRTSRATTSPKQPPKNKLDILAGRLYDTVVVGDSGLGAKYAVLRRSRSSTASGITGFFQGLIDHVISALRRNSTGHHLGALYSKRMR